ncbi:MAG: cell wall-binding protein [Hungatella sp.]|nr:cell wall-binding protein [Hungatella sp.]
MRKQTKLVAVLSAAALLAIGASMTSFAAGWTQEDDTWVYLDRDGDRVTEEWKKSGANYYWLNEDGEMAMDALIEDDDDHYYVDANGVRVTNQWVSVENEDDDDVDGKEVDVLWHYMGSSGKAYKANAGSTFKKSTINGKKYFFDDAGHMVSGWTTDTDGAIYYLGGENEGWAYTAWQYLEIDEDIEDSYDDNEAWFYFQSSGKARRNERKYIGGKYYAFDENGVLITDWQEATPGGASVATPSKIDLDPGERSYYDINDGDQGSGWVYTYADKDETGDEKWFYLISGENNRVFNANGKDSNGASAEKYTDGTSYDSTKTNVAARIIKGKTYLFDNKGQMLTGVFKFDKAVSRGNSSDLKAGVYYFNKSSGSVEGQMVTGKTTITYDGDNYAYYFKEDGTAYRNIIKNGSAYDDLGVRIEAEDGNSNSIKYISDIKGGLDIDGNHYTKGTIVVSSSGKVKKGTSTVTIDGTKYTVSGYLVTKAVDKDDDKVAVKFEEAE